MKNKLELLREKWLNDVDTIKKINGGFKNKTITLPKFIWDILLVELNTATDAMYSRQSDLIYDAYGEEIKNVETDLLEWEFALEMGIKMLNKKLN